ncbi:NAD(P)-binding protein [Punctularia strigosozonata HHB-11173 SS5]|uniref:Probable quinone oxidoreductase n=1 Tax=Punctularia strigosozonata (strain HHB-11173) TaxID=741275 RepID=R7S5C4_PUNST|nr:NAD(P)-binding protein [Punctularia strigosozonata HHB-11173 SS5]EIN04576.1 NAD(P)-binding protein [Punctularia strigosozonata HHB-11173 SS5]
MSVPTKIQAITFAKQGGVEVIEKTEIPFSRGGPGHVIVKVHYGGVNFIDTYFRGGIYPVEKFPGIIGHEAAGEIVELPTDENVLNSEVYKKRGLSIGSRVAFFSTSTFAEYVSVPWEKAVVLPDSVTYRIGAASILQGLTALSFVTEAYEVKKGDTVFVHTVAGGLGLFFAQLAKARGATVIGTTSTPEKAEIAKAHGADHVILYKNEDTAQRVKEITNGQGVDVVYDGVGKDTFELDFEIIKRKGTIVSVGNASGAVPPFPPLKLTPKNLRILRPSLANYLVTPEETDFYGPKFFSHIADGSLKVNVFREYPFTAEGVRQSQLDLTGGKTTGKLLIKIID